MAAYFNVAYKVTRQALVADTAVQIFAAPLANRLAISVTNDDPGTPQLAIGDSSAVLYTAGSNQGKPIPPGGEWWNPFGPAVTAIWIIADRACTITVEEFS